MFAMVIRPWQWLPKETPNLIILDLGLPVGDGFAILNVKEYPALRGSGSSFLRVAIPGTMKDVASRLAPSLFFSETARRSGVDASDSLQPAASVELGQLVIVSNVPRGYT